MSIPGSDRDDIARIARLAVQPWAEGRRDVAMPQQPGIGLDHVAIRQADIARIGVSRHDSFEPLRYVLPPPLASTRPVKRIWSCFRQAGFSDR